MHEELLQKLNSRSHQIRGEALHEARAFPPEDLLALIQAGAAYYRRRSQIGAIVSVVLLMGAVVLSWMLYMDGGYSHPILPIMYTSVGLVPAMLYYLPRRMYRSLSNLLNGIHDVRFLSPALAMWVYASDAPSIQYTLRHLLIRLLEQVRASDAPLITPEAKKQIVAMLSPLVSQELVIAALKALGQIGDASVLFAVRSVRTGAMTNQNTELIAAATECIELIEANGSARQQAQTLLRASGPNVAAPNTLLRAAIATNEATAPEQLLRPQVAGVQP